MTSNLRLDFNVFRYVKLMFNTSCRAKKLTAAALGYKIDAARGACLLKLDLA